MKKLIFTLAITLVVGGATLVLAHGPKGSVPGTSSGGTWMGCCGPMQDRMMGHRMGMMGRGWMRSGWMHGNSCSWDACPWDGLTYTSSGQLAEPLTKVQVQAMAEHFVAENPNLKVGKVTEKDGIYVVEIVTKKGSALVDKIGINKITGMMQPVK